MWFALRVPISSACAFRWSFGRLSRHQLDMGADQDPSLRASGDFSDEELAWLAEGDALATTSSEESEVFDLLPPAAPGRRLLWLTALGRRPLWLAALGRRPLWLAAGAAVGVMSALFVGALAFQVERIHCFI